MKLYPRAMQVLALSAVLAAPLGSFVQAESKFVTPYRFCTKDGACKDVTARQISKMTGLSTGELTAYPAKGGCWVRVNSLPGPKGVVWWSPCPKGWQQN